MARIYIIVIHRCMNIKELAALSLKQRRLSGDVPQRIVYSTETLVIPLYPNG